MNKKLLLGLCALVLGGQMMAQSQLCQPMLKWGYYACFSKIEISNVVSTFPTLPSDPEWGGIGKPSYDEVEQFGDFTADDSKIINLTPGQEYDLKLTICNFSSGAGDEYHLSIFADWNNDTEITKSEIVSEQMVKLLAPGQSSFVMKTIKITVPESASENATLRVYLHMEDLVAYPYEEPCSDQDGGMLKDYKMSFGGTSIDQTTASALSVYPNPTDGTVFINAEGAGEYMLYSVDGKLVQRGIVDGNAINVSSNQSGMYILKVQTATGVEQTSLIIK